MAVNSGFFNTPNNNGPLPPMPMNNPTGGLYNFGGESGSSFPSYNLNPSESSGPMANMPMFSGASGGLANMSSGFNFWGQGDLETNLYNSVGKAYGKGMGALIGHDLTAGFFNPTVAASYLNAMQPAYNKGMGDIQASFGAEGSRFGSAAALGEGNYASQFGLNEQQTLASMYMQAQQMQLNLLDSILPTMHSERANSGGVLSDILGGLEVVGGAIAAPFTGGATIPLIGAGIGTIAGGNRGGGGSQTPSIAPYQIPSANPNTTTPPFFPTSPQNNQNIWQMYDLNQLTGSAGDAISDTQDPGWNDLNEFLDQGGNNG